MKGEEIIEILSVERACICRQARGDCQRICMVKNNRHKQKYIKQPILQGGQR